MFYLVSMTNEVPLLLLFSREVTCDAFATP